LIFREKRSLISNELALRKKALLVENFPNQELINEFLVRKGSVPSKLDLEWKKPKIVEFIVSTIYIE
jgi:flap endonuclease GEN